MPSTEPTGHGAVLRCPHCSGHVPVHLDEVDPGVRTWFTEEPWDTGEPARALYAAYLSEFGDRPVTWDKFVADLQLLGVRRDQRDGVSYLSAP